MFKTIRHVDYNNTYVVYIVIDRRLKLQVDTPHYNMHEYKKPTLPVSYERVLIGASDRIKTKAYFKMLLLKCIRQISN